MIPPLRPPSRPMFLGRTPYRRRRLRDAARLLPIVGVLLLILPMLWSPIGIGRLLSGDLVYFFAVWLLLILVAAAFAPGLSRSEAAQDEEED